MISISFREFVVTGKFGPVQPGMTRSDVERLLGEPEAWGTAGQPEIAAIWKYGEIEFHFSGDELCSIFSDQGFLTDGGEICRIDPWIIRAGLPLAEFQAALEAADIGYAVSQPSYDARQRFVLTSTNIQFGFLEGEDSEYPNETSGLRSWSQRMNADRAAAGS